MRIAPEGWPFIIGGWLLLIPLWAWRTDVAIAWSLVAIWLIAFFRDPSRPGPRGKRVIIAPADGKVVSVIAIDEPAVIKGAATRVSIFMNVFNVHVNRYPANGEVVLREHRQGAFLNAATEKASLENEQADIGLMTSSGPMLIRQIAGLVARRIVTDHQVGHLAEQGERLGLIRFGSRVDLFFPAGTAVNVKVGDKTLAGQTIIGEWQ